MINMPIQMSFTETEFDERLTEKRKIDWTKAESKKECVFEI